MSLSFVSSAVLSSTDGVSHNEEKTIESKEVTQLRLKNSGVRPLFEQLRSNQESEQEKHDEIAKEMRMGMRPLDEEDCAHLDAMEQIRMERERMVKQGIEEELAFFRAAKAEKAIAMENQLNQPNQETNEQLPEEPLESKISPQSNTITAVVPRIVGKRKKRKQKTKSISNSPENVSKHQRTSDDQNTRNNQQNPTKNKTEETQSINKEIITTMDKTKLHEDNSDTDDDNEAHTGSLGGLLGGYGSESD